MTRDEILDKYEDVWRRAALSGRRQGRAPVGDSGNLGGGDCAWTADHFLADRLWDSTWLDCAWWRCPECGEQKGELKRVMIHLNDAHEWTWDRFANKFRDVLAQGERLASES